MPVVFVVVLLLLQVVHKFALLPALRDGDWLMFPFAGAYTICAASNYGGVRFTQPLKLFIHSGSVCRDTCGWDMAAGESAAAAAAWNVHKGADGSCCGSDASCAADAGVSVSVDSDNSGSMGGGGNGSPCSVVGCAGVGCLAGALGCMGGPAENEVACRMCGSGSCAEMDAQQGCVFGAAASADDGCMSVASEGTAAAEAGVLEGCGDSQLEAEINSMVIV
jgi:hypothetical protein